MRPTFADSPEFLRLLRDDPRADLTRIAFEIARDAYPSLDTSPYLAEIDALAARVRGRCPSGASTRQVLGHINWVLYVEEGFRGNTDDYYDARNSYLNEVLDRRTGIPISLAVVYLAIADRVGLPMAGVNLPAHFMVRTVGGERTHFVDPFHSGQVLDRVGCERRLSELAGRSVTLSDAQLAACPARVLVARMLRNLKVVFMQGDDYPAALPVLRRLVGLDPRDPGQRRDLGLTCFRTGLPGEAIGHIEAYLDAQPDAEDVEALRQVLSAARRDLALRN